MPNLGMKSVLLLLFVLAAITQIAFFLGYRYFIQLQGSLAHPHNTPTRGGEQTEIVPSADSGSNNILLTSCGTEDLGVAVAKVRTAVVYITGRRTTPSVVTPPKGPVSFAPATLTGDKMGSGIIFSAKGYAITNYHVVADTSDLRVSTFADRETAFPCKVVHADPQSDLAIIKIDTPYALPSATFGNSDMLEVGDPVLAVGCPFNLEQSVTHGIVSDTKRTVTIDGRTYVDLLQTDAAINSGNSGGALVNENGEVVGINVAIYAPSRVYCGVGFAIPINRAKLLLMKAQYLEMG